MRKHCTGHGFRQRLNRALAETPEHAHGTPPCRSSLPREITHTRYSLFLGFSACALNCPRSTSAAYVGNFPPREIRKLRTQFSCATELRACAIPNARIRTFPFSGICAYSPDGNPVRFYPSATYMVRAIGVPLLTESGRVDLPFCSVSHSREIVCSCGEGTTFP